MQAIKGENLTTGQKRQVLSAFPYRHLAIGEGRAYENTEQWIVEHAFYFKNNGQLALKPNHCISVKDI